MNIKRNIIFTLEKRKKGGVIIVENIPIRMRVIYNGKRVEFTTGYRIDESKWDSTKQRVRSGCTNKLKQSASEINTDLLRYFTEIQNTFKEFEVQNLIPTPEELKEAFNRLHDETEKEVEEETPAPLIFNPLDVFSEFTKESGMQNGWSKATYEKFAAVKAHLSKFDSEVSFESLSESYLTRYVKFLEEKEGLRNTSILKQIAYLKWFLRWCSKKGYCMNNDYECFNPKLKSTPKKVIFLTWNELTKLREYVIPAGKQYLERVRDVFLFQCFTGLSYSDVLNLRRSDVKENHIEVTTVKTADSLVIELNNYSKAILDKYESVAFKGDKVLPVISNQKMNDYLKELAKLAKIDEPVRETYYKGNERIDLITPKYELLGTHAGRRTFICNALSLGIPAQVVMKWTGHSDYKAMKPYIDIADDIKASAMDKFNTI